MFQSHLAFPRLSIDEVQAYCEDLIEVAGKAGGCYFLTGGCGVFATRRPAQQTPRRPGRGALLGGHACTHHRRDPILPGHDGTVRQRAANVGDQSLCLGKEGRPGRW